MADMNMGDAMKIAVVIQDLTRSGMARLARSLRQIPSEVNIDVRDNFGKLKGIQNLKSDINSAGKEVLKLNEYLSEKLGDNFLKGLIADAQRTERNLKKVEATLNRLEGSMDKNQRRSFMRSFYNIGMDGKKSALSLVGSRLNKVGAEIDAGSLWLSNTKSHDTELINKKKAELESKKREYDFLSRVQASMNKHIDLTEKKNAAFEKRQARREDAAIRQGENRKANIKHGAGKFKLGLEYKERFNTYKTLSKAERDAERKSITQSINTTKANYNRELAALNNINSKDKAAIQSQQRVVDELQHKWNNLFNLRQKMAGFEGSVAKAQARQDERTLNREIAKEEQRKRRLEREIQRRAKEKLNEQKKEARQEERNLGVISRLSQGVRNLFNKRGFNKLEQKFRGMSPDAQQRAFQMINGRMARVTENLANAKNKLEATPKSQTASINSQREDIRKLSNEYTNLDRIQRRMNSIISVRNSRQEAQAKKDQAKSQRLINEQVRMYRQELNGVNTAMQSTSNFASQLREDLSNAFSWYALKNFLHNLIEIGGQFEYQRRAISNILRDETKANKLFSQIKELGLRSPFSTLELDQYTKQLSAFNIPYNQMFEKLKKIADIAAGTGADMSRIILAYGHVKSEGFLTGIQRRQFSNANIGIVKGLSDYYSEREGRRVTISEVYKRIHDKQVTFEDTDAVLMSFAEEGGQFYNMQEVMADTVKGTYKNLGDALNHTYSAIEKTSSGLLGGFGQALTFILRLIEKFPSAAITFISAATAMAAVRTLVAKATNQEAAASIQRAIALDRESVAIGRNTSKLMATQGGFWAKRFGGAAMTQESLKSHGKLMKKDAMVRNLTLQSIAQRKLNIESAQYLLQIKAITQAEYQWALSQRNFKNTMLRFVGSIKTAFTGLWSTIWPMLALTAVWQGGSWLIDKITDKEGNERRLNMAKALADTYDSVKRAAEEIPDKPFESMDRATIWESITEMANAIKDNLADSEQILTKVFARDSKGEFLHNSVQQAEMLKKHLIEAEMMLGKLAGEGSIELYDAPYIKEKFDNFKEEEKDYVKAVNDMLNSPYRHAILQHLKSQVDEKPELKELVKDVNPEDNPMLYVRRLFDSGKHISPVPLSEDEDRFSKANQAMLAARGAADSWSKSLKKFREEVLITAYKWNQTAINQGMKGADEKRLVMMSALGSIPDLDKRAMTMATEWIDKKYFPSNYVQPLNGEIPSQDLMNAAKLVQDAQSSSGYNGKMYIPQATDNLVSMIEGIVKMYEEADGEIKKLSKLDIVKGFGINEKKPDYVSLSGIGSDTLSQEYGKDWNASVNTIKNAEGAALALGLTIEMLKKLMKSNKGSNEDVWLKNMRERIEQIKKAAQMYEEWRKVFGADAARNRISQSNEFKGLFKDWSNVNLGDMKGLLEAELAKSGWDANANRKKFKYQVGSEVLSYELKDAKDLVDRGVKKMDEYMKDKKDAFNIYTKMFEVTGNHNAASLFAYGIGGSRKSFDQYIIEAFNEGVAKNLQGTGLKTFTYEQALGFTEEEWKTYGESIRKTFEDSKDAVESWQKAQKEKYIDFLKSGKSYDSIVGGIEAKYLTDKELVGNDTDALNRVEATRQLALAEADIANSGFLDRITSFDFDTATKTLENYYNAVERAYATGSISAEEYRDKIDKIRKAMDSTNNANILGFSGGASAFLKGGLPGFFDKVKQDYDTRFEKGISSEERSKREKAFNEVFGKDGLKQAVDNLGNFNHVIGAAIGILDGFQGAFKALSDMFDALGKKDTAFTMQQIADSIGVGTSVLNPVSDVIGSMTKGDVGGMLSNVIQAPVKLFTNPISAIARIHDNRLNKKIEDSHDKLKDLQAEYKELGATINRSLTIPTEELQESYDNLVAQEAELTKQLDLERKKKKSDDDAIREYETQIMEIKDQIKYYWSDLLKEMFGIDFQSYGKRLTNAITEAFKKGEDAAIAWKRTVGDIVRDLANQLIETKLVMPVLDEVFNAAFGEDGKSGRLGGKEKITEEDIKWLGNMLNSGVDSVIPTAKMIYDAVDYAFPYSSEGESVGGLSKIGQNITEETGGVIASYMNTIRTDVSVNRKNLQAVVDKGIPALQSVNEVAKAQLSQMNQIAENTRSNAESAAAILNILKGVSNGTKTFSVK